MPKLFRPADAPGGVRPARQADWLRSSALLAGRVRLWQRALAHKPVAKLAAWGCHVAGRSDVMVAVANVENWVFIAGSNR